MKIDRVTLPIASARSAMCIAAFIFAGCGAAGVNQVGPTEDLDSTISFDDEASDRLPRSALVRRAEAALGSGEGAQAQSLFEEAIQANSEDLRALLGLGLAFEMQEDLSRAEATYRQALLVDPAFADALNNLGLLLRDRGEFTGAVQSFRAAVSADPDRTEAYANLALTLDDAEAPPEQVRQAYDLAIQRSPRDATLRANLGLYLLRVGEVETGADELRRALPLARENPVALLAIGNGLRRAGRYPDAVEAMTRAVQAHPQGGTPALYAELTLAHMAARDGAAAEASAGRAIELDPSYALAHFLLGRILLARNACAEATTAMREYLRLEPQGDHAAAARGSLRCR